MLRASAAASLLLISSGLYAGGPLVLEGPAGNTPATYENQNITFNFDQGKLGTRTNDAADQLVRDAFAMWNNVSKSTANLAQGSDILTDINSSNFASYIPDPNNPAVHNADDCINPVVYDTDGSIIDAFFGAGASDTTVGFASSSILIGGNYFLEGFAVINGKTLPGTNNNAVMTRIIAHEIGHFIGLDHTQADISNTESFFDSCPTPGSDYPLMYPYACRDENTLHPDDEATVSTLYPSSNYYQNHGQIQGTFLTAGDTAIRGANIWAENTQTGEIYSVVSDFLRQDTGFFSFTIPPGNYTLHANSLNVEFFAASSVGPYAETDVDVSFQAPASNLPGVIDFNGALVVPEVLNVAAGKSINVVFKADGSGNFTMNNDILNLSPAHNPAAVCSVNRVSSGGGGSGVLTPLMLLPMLAVMLLRRRCGSKALSS